ncbi:hypothetical protein N8I77_013024 [Diaporthe amygdali]|uniref:Nephrocystin 3-like N-terminal domain-containing protein n=1 Tax=Phomopsis amygdali TaxID=1214568 RepID=A0AAD9S3F2_PHOAM|nr:hypothetical protein N8I77_013024 [Diaporthe amygdali]
MVDPILSHQSVSGSNFGSHAKLHIGDYNVHLQDKAPRDQSNSSADDQFLSDLSSIHPTNQWASVKRPSTQTAQEGFQDWSAKTRFDDWFSNSERKLLWVQDETLSHEGGSLLISDIIEDFEEQNRLGRITQNNDRTLVEENSALAYFYCSCLHKGQQWTPSQVFGGLIYMLLQGSSRFELLQTTRQTYSRRLKASSEDDSRFQVLVEILLNIFQSDIFGSLPRITLIVEAIDQCGADAQDVGVPDLLDAMNQCLEQVPNLKWVMSSRTTSGALQMLADSESDYDTLKLSYADVGRGLGLASMIDTILDVGARMQRMYEDSKCRVKMAPDSYRWFQYSKAGASWLKGPQNQAHGSTGASIVWYERERSLAYEPSPLALHIADAVCPRVGLQLDVVYYSCHSALKANHDSSDSFRETFKTQPTVALFCMLCHMVYGACQSGDDWAKVAVDLPRKLRKNLESLTSRITKIRKERHARTSHPEDPVTVENGPDLSENLQDITTKFPLGSVFLPTREDDTSAKIEGWYRDLEVRDHYAPIIVDLIASVASRLPNDVLLVFDSLEQMDHVMWKRTLQILRDNMSYGVRILLCGNSEAIDQIWGETTTKRSEGWRKFVGR